MNYIDLGLPSCTLWADENAEGYYAFDEAKKKFRESLPTIEQWQELIDNCEWLWDLKKKQMVVIGKNGNKIILPAAGGRDGINLYGVGSNGYYWSSSIYTDRQGYAYYVHFYSGGVYRFDCSRFSGQSVRLIKNTSKDIKL